MDDAIQVRLGAELVGTFNTLSGVEPRERCSIQKKTNPDGDWVIDIRTFAIKEMRVNYPCGLGLAVGSYARERDLREAFERDGVPEYAERSEKRSDSVVTLSWKALKLETREDHQWIFDLPEFNPVDTEPDYELAALVSSGRLNEFDMPEPAFGRSPFSEFIVPKSHRSDWTSTATTVRPPEPITVTVPPRTATSAVTPDPRHVLLGWGVSSPSPLAGLAKLLGTKS